MSGSLEIAIHKVLITKLHWYMNYISYFTYIFNIICNVQNETPEVNITGKIRRDKI